MLAMLSPAGPCDARGIDDDATPPSPRESAASTGVAGPAPGRPQRPKVLVLEDDEATSYALARLFRASGWEVLRAATVAAGLALLEARPDWAILDLNLPDGDGDRVLSAIRAAGLPVRVVVASATADPAHLARAAGLGPDHLMRKPVDPTALLRAVGLGDAA